MKTYKDLVFGPHPVATEVANTPDGFSNAFFADMIDAKQAVLCFDNGYGISVIKDCPFITGRANYECAVLKGTTEKYELIYPEFAPDVVRLNTEEEITELMKTIQEMESGK